MPSCAEGGVLGVLPSIIGSIQTTEAIKIITGIGQTLSGKFLLLDALHMEFNTLTIARDKDCLVCGDQPTIKALIDYQQFCGVAEPQDLPFDEISVQELKAQLDAGNRPLILDVREPFERQIAQLPDSVPIPMNEVSSRLAELNPEWEIIVHCKSGGRSAKICQLLINNHFTHVKNLKGGINAWAEAIDLSMQRY